MKITNKTGILHHRIKVHERQDRIGFEVLLPCDAVLVHGLVAVCNPGSVNLTRVGSNVTKVGTLTLRWNGPGDIFYQGAVLTRHATEENYKILGLSKPDQFLSGTDGFTTESNRIEAIAIPVPGGLRLIKGYYVDHINRVSDNNEDYTVDLFFYYQRREK